MGRDFCDRFGLGGDAGPVTVDAIPQPAQVGPHTLDGIQGALEIHGSSVDFSARPSALGVPVPFSDLLILGDRESPSSLSGYCHCGFEVPKRASHSLSSYHSL